MSTIAEHLALIEALRLTGRNEAAHHESWLFNNVHWQDLVAMMPAEEMRVARVQTEQRLRDQHPEHADELISDWRSKRPAEAASGADLAVYRSIADNYLAATPLPPSLPAAQQAEPLTREWSTPPASWRLLAKAAINLLCAIDEKHDTKTPPHKYAVPYAAVNDLRRVLGATEPTAHNISAAPAGEGETR